MLGKMAGIDFESTPSIKSITVLTVNKLIKEHILSSGLTPQNRPWTSQPD